MGWNSLPAFSENAIIETRTSSQKLDMVWNHFLSALGTGSDRAVHSLCTEGGYQTLVSFLNPQEPHADQWRRWGASWGKWGALHWQSITPIIAYGKLGPAQKPASINFALTADGWKIDGISPAK